MINLLTATENLPFTVALVAMVAIALVEGLGLLMGTSVSALLEPYLPDFDLDVDGGTFDVGADVDVDADLDVDADVDVEADLDAGDIGHDAVGAGQHGGAGSYHLPSGLTGFLGWLRLGQVPLLVWLVLFLTTFGLAGLFLQEVVSSLFGGYLPAVLASGGALAVALPVTRSMARLVAKILPKEESSAVSAESLVGRVAVVILGTARPGQPAQAKVKDQHGQTHYVLVEPDGERDLPTGMPVLLVKRQGAVFLAIENPKPALVD